MCTLTWLHHPDGFELIANRDELRTRPLALPPTVRRAGGLRILAPTDPEGGGTWIGVNDRGLVLCLLNADLAPVEEPPEGFTSRGLLVQDLLACPSAADVARELERASLRAYRGFALVALAPGLRPVVHAWDGVRRQEARPDDAALPLVSSSRDPGRAGTVRRDLWRRKLGDSRPPDVDLLRAFHASHEPEAGPWSVCMHREDARTVSASHLSVGPEAATFRYAPGPPCRTAFGEGVTLPLGS